MTEEAKSKTSLLSRANELRLRGDYRAAIGQYIEYMERFEATADLYAVVAECHFALAMGNPSETGQGFEEAIDWMRKGVAKEPNDARLRARLAELYALGTVDYTRAAEEYCAAIELNPNHTGARVGLAALYGVPEQVVALEEAIDCLEHAVRMMPNEVSYHHRLGSLHFAAGRLCDAEREWFKALTCPQPLDPVQMRTILSALTDRE